MGRDRGDEQWGTIGGLFRSAAIDHAEREAVVEVDFEASDLTVPSSRDVRLTYEALGHAVEEATRAVLAAGVEPGDRVAIWAPNMWEWIVALGGVESAGGVLVPLNTRYKGTEARFILAKSRARLLFTVEGFLDNHYVSMLRDSGPAVDDGGSEGASGSGPVSGLPDLEQIIVFRGDVADGATSWAQFLADGVATTDDEVETAAAAVSGDDLADILFTSGTTGNPKGVMCTHAQTLRSFATWSDVVGLDRDRYLIVNPFFHAFGYKAGILASLMTGSTMVPVPVFDVPTVMTVAAREQVSMLPGPPAVYQTILNHPDLDSFDLSGLSRAVTGAAAIPVSLIEQMRDVLGFDVVVTGYGLTEACGIATMCRHDDDPVTIATTSGRAIPDVEVEVHDESGSAVAPGESGEVVVRGYNVMRGYFEDADQTAATVDASGWLHTGDIGTMDERGYLKITDRLKDMFIVGGFNAYPAEIENLLVTHPDIAQVAVIGVPDDRLGEVGHAFVVPAGGSTPDADSLREWSRETMANFKVPRTFEFVESLPMNPSGKVQKFVLREQLT